MQWSRTVIPRDMQNNTISGDLPSALPGCLVPQLGSLRTYILRSIVTTAVAAAPMTGQDNVALPPYEGIPYSTVTGMHRQINRYYICRSRLQPATTVVQPLVAESGNLVPSNYLVCEQYSGEQNANVYRWRCISLCFDLGFL